MFRDEELLKEISEAQIKNKESLKNENQNDNEDSLYRLNIKDSTPEMIKENVVIPNYEKYKKFFVTYEAYEDDYKRESVMKVLNFSGIIRSFSDYYTHNLLIKNPGKSKLEDIGYIP